MTAHLLLDNVADDFLLQRERIGSLTVRQAKFNQTLAIFRAARVGSIICGFGVNEAILAKNDNDGNLSGTFSRRHGPGLQAAR
ncbi:MAG: hypothetical protein ACE5EY_05310, partial [Anaerolineae bacterium]